MKFGLQRSNVDGGVVISCVPDNDAERTQLNDIIIGFPTDLVGVCQGTGGILIYRNFGWVGSLQVAITISPAQDLNQAAESPERKAHERKPQ